MRPSEVFMLKYLAKFMRICQSQRGHEERKVFPCRKTGQEEKHPERCSMGRQDPYKVRKCMKM